jgi:O-antigen ligase
MSKLSQLLNKIQTGLLLALVFLIPTNLFFKLTEQTAYVDGLLVDYLIPKVYLQDILILLILLIALFKARFLPEKKLHLKNKLNQIGTWVKSNPIILSFWLVCFIRQLISPNPTASIWFMARFILLGVFFIWTRQNKKITKSQHFYWAGLASLTFQSILVGYQLITQKQLAGYLFLGEPDLTQPFGLAEGSLFNQKIVLPYGTSAHPNVLAGASLIFWWLIQTQAKKVVKNKDWRQVLSLISTICHVFILTATQSISAILSTAIGLILLMINKSGRNFDKLKLVWLILILSLLPISLALIGAKYKHPSFSRRNNLNQAGWQMLTNKPLLGVGLNNFTVKLEKYGASPEIVRFVQPAHHFVLLWAAETGILGVLLLILLINLLKKTSSKTKLLNLLLLIAPILALDHYLLTIATGQLSLLLGLLITRKKT